jgi:hypothetical protein
MECSNVDNCYEEDAWYEDECEDGYGDEYEDEYEYGFGDEYEDAVLVDEVEYTDEFDEVFEEDTVDHTEDYNRMEECDWCGHEEDEEDEEDEDVDDEPVYATRWFGYDEMPANVEEWHGRMGDLFLETEWVIRRHVDELEELCMQREQIKAVIVCMEFSETVGMFRKLRRIDVAIAANRESLEREELRVAGLLSDILAAASRWEKVPIVTSTAQVGDNVAALLEEADVCDNGVIEYASEVEGGFFQYARGVSTEGVYAAV